MANITNKDNNLQDDDDDVLFLCEVERTPKRPFSEPNNDLSTNTSTDTDEVQFICEIPNPHKKRKKSTVTYSNFDVDNNNINIQDFSSIEDNTFSTYCNNGLNKIEETSSTSSDTNVSKTIQKVMKRTSAMQFNVAEQNSEVEDNKDKTDPSNNKMSGVAFKEVVGKVLYREFGKPYSYYKIGVWPCCSAVACSNKHKALNLSTNEFQEIHPREIPSRYIAPLFNNMDCKFNAWIFDVVPTAYRALNPEWYLGDDVLRVFFDYVLNGPENNLCYSVAGLLITHFCDVHPPCQQPMREYYKSLLSEKCGEGSFFNTKQFSAGLLERGVLDHILGLMEQYFHSNSSVVDEDLETGMQEDNTFTSITLELLEDRHDNCEPLLGREVQAAMSTLDRIANIANYDETRVLTTADKKQRLALALELVVDLLQADLLICISKLKRYISGEDLDPDNFQPIIKDFMDNHEDEGDSFQHKVFKFYTLISLKDFWPLLSKMIGMMAESVHLFSSRPKKCWKYPNLHPDCLSFVSTFFTAIYKSEWAEKQEVMLDRLSNLKPDWLRLEVVMRWVNSDLSLKMSNNLQGVVDIIHMHVKSRAASRILKKPKVTLKDAQKASSEKLMKKLNKKNQYGEELLHIICKQNHRSVQELVEVLACEDVDVNAQDYVKWTPLHVAVEANSLNKVEILLNYQPPPGKSTVNICAQNENGTTPLHVAVSRGNLKMCQLLVDFGGTSLLRKLSLQEGTPLDLARTLQQEPILEYFELLLAAQEKMDLSANAELCLSEHVMCLLNMACWSSLDAYSTLTLHDAMKSHNLPMMQKQGEKEDNSQGHGYILTKKDVLRTLKTDQNQFSKLRRILLRLKRNEKNKWLVDSWEYVYAYQPRTSPSQPNEEKGQEERRQTSPLQSNEEQDQEERSVCESVRKSLSKEAHKVGEQPV